MADEYTNINKYAHEGGDTAPGTREQIADRNKAADTLAQASVDNAKARRELEDEHRDKMAQAEEQFTQAVPNPDVVPPARGAGAPEGNKRSDTAEVKGRGR